MHDLKPAIGNGEYRYPFPAFPNGWFPVEVSHKLTPGQHISKHVLGKDVVVYRTESGKANVIGAYCPHMGAHIGIGGSVIGEQIRCPFHAWDFGLSGRCEAAQGARRVPDASVETYHVVERNGTIFIWHDMQGRAPSWEVPLLEETVSGDFEYLGFHQFNVKCHPQEMFENLSDFRHLQVVHGWSPQRQEWSFPEGEIATTVTMDVTANDPSIRNTIGVSHVHVTNLGPSYSYARSTGAIQALQTLMFCPTRPGELEAPAQFWVHKSTPKREAEQWKAGFIHDFGLDIPILENKRYLTNPKMSDADGPIHVMRKWYSQWYD